MQTQVTIEELDSTRRRIAVEVPVEAVVAEMDRAYGRVQRHAHLKGFRPGHVPRAVLEKYFGDQVRADVLSHLIEHSYSDAVAQSGLKPVGPPEIVPENIEAGRPLRYSATVDIRPEIEMRDYRGLPAKRPLRPVADADVESALASLRESLAELRPVEGRDEVRAGDFAAIDYVASIGGKPLPEGRRENRLVEVGKGAVPPEIDRALVGMKVGESRAAEVEFPADHPDPQLAGKPVRFEVALRGLREKVVPEADDELAKEHGECTTLEDLKAKLRERIADSFRREAQGRVEEQLVDEVLRRNPFDVPKSLIERQIDGFVEDVLERLGPQAKALQQDAERLSRLRDDARPRAERQVRAALALEAIAQQANVEVADADVERRIDEMASQVGERAEKLRAAYADAGARADLRSRLARERALEIVVASATVEDVEAPSNGVAPSAENG